MCLYLKLGYFSSECKTRLHARAALVCSETSTPLALAQSSCQGVFIIMQLPVVCTRPRNAARDAETKLAGG